MAKETFLEQAQRIHAEGNSPRICYGNARYPDDYTRVEAWEPSPQNLRFIIRTEDNLSFSQWENLGAKTYSGGLTLIAAGAGYALWRTAESIYNTAVNGYVPEPKKEAILTEVKKDCLDHLRKADYLAVQSQTGGFSSQYGKTDIKIQFEKSAQQVQTEIQACINNTNLEEKYHSVGNDLIGGGACIALSLVMAWCAKNIWADSTRKRLISKTADFCKEKAKEKLAALDTPKPS